MTEHDSVNFGIAIPKSASTSGDSGEVRVFLARAEELGYTSVWVAEQMWLGRRPQQSVADHLVHDQVANRGPGPSFELPRYAARHDPLTLMAFAAAVTTRVSIGSAVLLPNLRSPIHLAKALATIDRLSDGRLIAGIAVGGNVDLYPAYALTSERHVARFREYVHLVRRLWLEDEVDHSGDFVQLSGATLEPKPVQRPTPPLWFGGHHSNALARSIDMEADGFVGGGSNSTTDFSNDVTKLRALLERHHRDPENFSFAKRVYLAVDQDRIRARARLMACMAAAYNRPNLVDDVCVFGGPAECIEGLAAVREAGAGTIILNPMFHEMEQIERLANEVVPALCSGDPDPVRPATGRTL